MSGASIYPAVQNMLLAARGLGLGSTLTTRHLLFEKEVNEVLGLPENAETFAILPIGYPMGKFGPVSRQAVETVTFQDRWGTQY
jgi:nitroreductase